MCHPGRLAPIDAVSCVRSSDAFSWCEQQTYCQSVYVTTNYTGCDWHCVNLLWIATDFSGANFTGNPEFVEGGATCPADAVTTQATTESTEGTTYGQTTATADTTATTDGQATPPTDTTASSTQTSTSDDTTTIGIQTTTACVYTIDTTGTTVAGETQCADTDDHIVWVIVVIFLGIGMVISVCFNLRLSYRLKRKKQADIQDATEATHGKFSNDAKDNPSSHAPEQVGKKSGDIVRSTTDVQANGVSAVARVTDVSRPDTNLDSVNRETPLTTRSLADLNFETGSTADSNLHSTAKAKTVDEMRSSDGNLKATSGFTPSYQIRQKKNTKADRSPATTDASHKVDARNTAYIETKRKKSQRRPTSTDSGGKPRDVESTGDPQLRLSTLRDTSDLTGDQEIKTRQPETGNFNTPEAGPVNQEPAQWAHLVNKNKLFNAETSSLPMEETDIEDYQSRPNSSYNLRRDNDRWQQEHTEDGLPKVTS